MSALRTTMRTRKVKKPKATWFKPRVLVDVEFRALTGTRKLRHPSYKGVRQNLDPRPVVRPQKMAHIGGMKRIAIGCLSCGHCTSISEERLKAFGLSPDAPIVKLIRRLTCTECGSVRAYRYDLQDVT
jgi:ATP dependent DNA ligase C terminal region